MLILNVIFLLLKQTIIKTGHVLSNVCVSMIMSRRPVSVPLRRLYICLTKGSQLVLLQAVGMKAHCQPVLRLRGPRLCTPAFSAQGQPARVGRTSRPLLRPRGPLLLSSLHRVQCHIVEIQVHKGQNSFFCFPADSCFYSWMKSICSHKRFAARRT